METEFTRTFVLITRADITGRSFALAPSIPATSTALVMVGSEHLSLNGARELDCGDGRLRCSERIKRDLL